MHSDIHERYSLFRITYQYFSTFASDSVGSHPPVWTGKDIVIYLPYDTSIGNGEEVILNLEVGFKLPSGYNWVPKLTRHAAVDLRLSLLHAEIG